MVMSSPMMPQMEQQVEMPYDPLQQQEQPQPTRGSYSTLGWLSIIALATGGAFMAGKKSTRAAVSMEIAVDGELRFGECKWFNSEKGFGFISVDGENQDVFVHQSEIYAEGFRSLAEGEKVEFQVEADPKNPSKFCATKVTGPDGSMVQGAPYNDGY
jgi:cold shock CspA family protein